VATHRGLGPHHGCLGITSESTPLEDESAGGNGKRRDEARRQQPPPAHAPWPQ